jgi:dephospho-CoA kinase/non-canonical purine NTP pyrophosphatase (RdgB/HAM1 family)
MSTPRAPRVGLTGGLASGKSTVGRWMSESGWTVVDADDLVRSLYRRGEPGAAAVARLFGTEALDEGGAVRSRWVAERVFTDPEARRTLEQAIHPLVRERFAEIAANTPGPLALEATLLVEAGFAPDFDAVLTVESSPARQLERAIARGLGPADARARLAAQGGPAGGAARRRTAHRILRNEGPPEELRPKLKAVLEEIHRLTHGQPLPLPRFALVTGNPGKLAEARRLWGAPLESVAADLEEIQSLALEEVLAAKAGAARAHLEGALAVEETGLYLAALNGFPGPLVKWMLDAIGPAGIARTALLHANPAATARCALLLRGEHYDVLGVGETAGQLVEPPRGNGGFGWDGIFQPEGASRTYAEMGSEEKDQVGHRGKAWRDLRRKLSFAGPG